jgi:hypothetical protein
VNTAQREKTDAMTYFSPGGVDQPQGPGYQGSPYGFGLGPPRKLRPGRIWYVVALAVLAAGIAFLAHGFASLAGTVDGLQRVSLPAGGTVSLPHGGGYIVYYEGPGARDGNIPFFHVNIAPASPGAAVARLARYGATVTYDIGSHQGRAVLSLRVPHAGRYAVTTTGPAPANADLAFGGSIGGGIVSLLLPAIPLIIVGFVATLLLFILRLVGKRSRQRAYA